MKRLALPHAIVLPALFIAALVLTSGATRLSSAPAAAANAALLDPNLNSAIRPTPGNARWLQRHEQFVAEAKQGGINVLFLGDSITDFWRNRAPRGGQGVWEREFAPLHAANFGISGDRTQNVLWRLQHGEVDGIDPKVVVLMIGTNNTGLERDNKTIRNTQEQAAVGVQAVIREVRARLPHSRVLLLAVFPRGATSAEPQRAQIDYINRQIAPLTDGNVIRYLDLGPKFLSPDGTLSKDIFPDLLHPNEKGYQIWAAVMRPVLLQMLAQPRI